MAHIPDGVLSLPVLAGGAVLAAAGIAWSLRYLDEQTIPSTAVLSAAFFAGSLVAVPVGPSSVHLLFSGLMGLLLGPLTILAVAVGLVLQLVMFGFGGVTTIGVNIVDIAGPGVLAGVLLGPLVRTAPPWRSAILAAIASFFAVGGTAAAVATAIALSSPDFAPSARIVLVTYLPLAAVEAIVTGTAVAFLRRAAPEALAAPRWA